VALATDIREQINDGIDRLGGLGEAALAGVTGLAAWFAPGGRRLGSGFGVEGKIGGRGLGGVTGVLVEASFELGEAGLKLGDESGQGSQFDLASAQESDLGFEFGDTGLKGSAAETGGIRRAHIAAIREGGRRFLPS
jgi:hypothetical protein